MVSHHLFVQDGSSTLSGRMMISAASHLSFTASHFVSVSRMGDDFAGISYVLDDLDVELSRRSHITCVWHGYPILVSITTVA